MQDVQCRLCGKDDDITVFRRVQGQLKDTEKRLAEGRAVLYYLQNQLIDVACDDPGAAIGRELALPILQVACAEFDVGAVVQSWHGGCTWSD